jgi:hypothetical protein
MRLYYTFLLVILLSAEMVQAQTINLISETVNQNDTVVIRLNDYTGAVQWQI